MTTATIISLIVAVLGAIGGGFKLWSAFFRDKKAEDAFQAGVDNTKAKVNQEAADAERRASEARTNAKSGSGLDDDLKSGRVQF